jgi:hypothetical protein
VSSARLKLLLRIIQPPLPKIQPPLPRIQNKTPITQDLSRTIVVSKTVLESEYNPHYPRFEPHSWPAKTNMSYASAYCFNFQHSKMHQDRNLTSLVNLAEPYHGWLGASPLCSFKVDFDGVIRHTFVVLFKSDKIG